MRTFSDQPISFSQCVLYVILICYRELATVYGSPGFMERQLRDFVEKTKGFVSRFTTWRARIPGIWLGEPAMTDRFSLLEFAVWIWVENSKMAVAEANVSCMATIWMNAWPTIGVIWPWRCCKKTKAHGKWQLTKSLYLKRHESRAWPSLGHAYSIKHLLVFLAPNIIFIGQLEKNIGRRASGVQYLSTADQ